MQTDFKVENPKEIVLTMTISMTLGEWQELSKQVSDKWPGTNFKDAIWRMEQAASKHFSAEE